MLAVSGVVVHTCSFDNQESSQESLSTKRYKNTLLVKYLALVGWKAMLFYFLDISLNNCVLPETHCSVSASKCQGYRYVAAPRVYS